MFDRVRRHLTPSMLIALLALVFAVTGGAFAASGHGGPDGLPGGNHGLSALAKIAKSKNKTSPRGPRGPRGATGLAGKTGATGAIGPVGPQGASGPAGPAGANGASGATGEPVKITKAGSAECKEGGTHFKNATGEGNACNGEASETLGGGESGLPVALPEGKTETGTWSAHVDLKEHEFKEGETELYVSAPLSFPVPLAAPLPEAQWHFVTIAEQEGTGGAKVPAECEGEPKPGVKVKGSVENPQAAKGWLCMYQGLTEAEAKVEVARVRTAGYHGSEPGSTEERIGTAGAIATVVYKGANEGPAEISGSWAVTAP